MKKNILDTLGQPLASNLVSDIFEEFNIRKQIKTFYSTEGSAIEAEGWYNDKMDVSVEFEQTSNRGKIVNEITIEPIDTVLSIELPFNLLLKDKAEDIIKKIGRKPKSKVKSSLISNDPELYQYAWWFEKENKKILTALNGHYELLWLRIMSYSQSELQVLELHKNLKLQKPNINSNIDFTNILKASPTIRWKESLQENKKFEEEKSDEFIENYWFNNSIIELAEELIEQYLEKIRNACSKRSGLQIYNSVKWFVKKLNKLNSKSDYFIETLERDELGVFIDKTIELTGLKLTDTIDITEQWREW